MDLTNKRLLIIGGAGLIGSHVVDELTRTDAREIVVYDNMVRGNPENLAGALNDPRVKIFPHGGDILQRDVLDRAMEGIDAVVHLAALWLLHCHEYPESAFEVNIRGTFNVLEACRRHRVPKLVYSSSASVYGDAVAEPMSEDHPYNNWTFYGATKIAGEHMLKAYHKRAIPSSRTGLAVPKRPSATWVSNGESISNQERTARSAQGKRLRLCVECAPLR